MRRVTSSAMRSGPRRQAALRAAIMAAAVALTGCGEASVTRNSTDPFLTGSVENLCTAYTESRNELERQLLETELVARKIVYCPHERVGYERAQRIGLPQYSRAPTSIASAEVATRKYKCKKFTSPMAAQRLFLLSGGPTHDIYGLDPDGDGNACGWGAVLGRVQQQVLPG